VARNPNNPGSPVPDASLDQLWSVDADGDAVLVARGSATAVVDFAALGSDHPGIETVVGVEAAAHAYDGYVPLVLDGLELAGVDATLDFLTTTPDLFVVPTLDSPASDDASAA